MASSVGFIELLFVVLSMGGPFSQLLGLPPGDRDPNLVYAASEDSIVYTEWASRGEGQVDAPSIDGLIADPEIKHFIAKLQAATEAAISKEANSGAFKELPEFVLTLSGRPGCFFMSLNSAAEQADVPNPVAMLNAIQAGLVINGGDEADAIASTIKAFLKEGMRVELEELDHFMLPLPAPVTVQLHRHNNNIIVGVGPDTVDQIVARLTAESGGMTNHAGFQSAWAELGMDRTGLITFVDIENGLPQIAKLVGVGQEAMVTSGLRMAGLSGAKWSMNVAGIVDGQSVRRGMVKGVSGDKGLMALLSGRGITADDFAMVPDDSDVVLAASIDIETIMTEAKAFLNGVDPNAADDIDQVLAAADKALGLNFRTDVLAAFDQVITVSNSPGDGGWVASSPVLTIKIKDKKKAALAMNAVADALNRELGERANRPRRAELMRHQFMETEIFMINVIGDDDVPVAPAWCLTETHLMFALHPQPLKSRLRRLKDDSWSSFGDHFAGGPDGDTVVFTSAKMKSLLPQIYGFTPWVGQIVFSNVQYEGFDISLFDFPSAQALLPYVTDSKSYIVKTPKGLQTQGEGMPVLSGVLPLSVPTLPFMLLTQRAQAVRAIEVEAYKSGH